jgi:hypothetical protein
MPSCRPEPPVPEPPPPTGGFPPPPAPELVVPLDPPLLEADPLELEEEDELAPLVDGGGQEPMT